MAETIPYHLTLKLYYPNIFFKKLFLGGNSSNLFRKMKKSAFYRNMWLLLSVCGVEGKYFVFLAKNGSK